MLFVNCYELSKHVWSLFEISIDLLFIILKFSKTELWIILRLRLLCSLDTPSVNTGNDWSCFCAPANFVKNE